MPNTTIKIYDENTNALIFEGKTDDFGKITITNLYVGDFRIEESDAPEGYILNDEPMYFSIKENGEIVKVNMVNERLVGVPNTLQEKDILIDIISATLLLSGIGIIFYVKKKNKDKK